MNTSASWMKIVSTLLFCATAGAAGCASAGADDGWTEDGAPPELVDDAPAPLMPRNSMSPEALSAEALEENEGLIIRLATHPLNDASLEEYRETAELNDNARALLEYTVSCALDPAERVLGSQGELGLCGAESPLNWADHAPSKDCLELVSACVLARVNAVGRAVRISTRSKYDGIPLRAQVPVETEYRDPALPAIRSFSWARSGAAQGNPARNHGWIRRFVGVCAPGRPVVLRQNPAAGDPLMVRVCKGIHGCDNVPPWPWYSGFIAEGALKRADDARAWSFATTPALGFTCPASDVPGASSFSVMVASPSPDPSVRPAAGADVILDAPSRLAGARYPATEREVFTFREGAFYGNLFAIRNATSAPHGLEVVPNLQYACYSDIWSSPMAHFADRLCAGGDTGCFANTPGACRLNPPGESGRDKLCLGENDDRSYSACAGPEGGAAWKHVVTVLLNHPCDLADDLVTCQVEQ
ncbi:hypothetical protein [Sorangium sp. So ce131]|uniref:hypothetical protein n=1 Tax=Sorangium sp. So ce131 TaxID=3133282 RepID=UPI003F5E526E